MTGRLSLQKHNQLKLGLFGYNCSSGRAMTTAPERWLADWDSCLAVAEMADAAGLDFLLPIARWKGYGGATDYQGTVLETITWACGQLARTKQINVFATVHAPLIHPVFAAKQFVTADHIGKGRFGLNVVIGWHEGEFNMFGIERHDHVSRYDYGQEWMDVILRAWREETAFDFNGQYLQLRGVSAKPKPYGQTRPILMNAGVSEQGRAFAIRNCDALFTGTRLATLETAAQGVADLKSQAMSLGRSISVFTVGEIVCRPTRSDAHAYYHYWTEEAVDWQAVDNMLAIKGEFRAADPERYEHLRKALVHGQAGFPMIGTPDDVADQLAALSAAGFDGIGFSFMNYLNELPYFCAEVLPRLKARGLRSSSGV